MSLTFMEHKSWWWQYKIPFDKTPYRPTTQYVLGTQHRNILFSSLSSWTFHLYFIHEKKIHKLLSPLTATCSIRSILSAILLDRFWAGLTVHVFRNRSCIKRNENFLILPPFVIIIGLFFLILGLVKMSRFESFVKLLLFSPAAFSLMLDGLTKWLGVVQVTDVLKAMGDWNLRKTIIATAKGHGS